MLLGYYAGLAPRKMKVLRKIEADALASVSKQKIMRYFIDMFI